MNDSNGAKIYWFDSKDPAMQQAVQDVAERLMPAIGKLQAYVAELDAEAG